MLKPKSILDVGCGNGKYGFLFREKLDWDNGRFRRKEWKVVIDGLDVYADYLTDIHTHIYNVCYAEDWLDFNIPCDYKYEMIFMGDVLEHFAEGDWQKALQKAKDHSLITICVCPNWEGSGQQGAWQGNKYEEHKVELSPKMVGGYCVFANTKAFITVHSEKVGIGKDMLL